MIVVFGRISEKEYVNLLFCRNTTCFITSVWKIAIYSFLNDVHSILETNYHVFSLFNYYIPPSLSHQSIFSVRPLQKKHRPLHLFSKHQPLLIISVMSHTSFSLAYLYVIHTPFSFYMYHAYIYIHILLH